MRGASPLLDSPIRYWGTPFLLNSLLLSQIQKSYREGKPLLLIPPLPLDKGKGIKGIGLPLNRGRAPLHYLLKKSKLPLHQIDFGGVYRLTATINRYYYG